MIEYLTLENISDCVVLSSGIKIYIKELIVNILVSLAYHIEDKRSTDEHLLNINAPSGNSIDLSLTDTQAYPVT